MIDPKEGWAAVQALIAAKREAQAEAKARAARARWARRGPHLQHGGPHDRPGKSPARRAVEAIRAARRKGD